MRTLAGLLAVLVIVMAAMMAIVVSVVVQALTTLLPALVCAGLILAAVHVARRPRAVGSRPPRRALPGAPGPNAAPTYAYTHQQWGWTRTPQGGWAWVSIWMARPALAEPADVVDAEVISEGPQRD